MKGSIVGFCRHNKHKKLTLKLYMYTCFYRMCVKLFPDDKLRRFMGEEGDASDEPVSNSELWYARLVGVNLERISHNTSWKTNCLVRTLTVKKLMEQKGIPYTLYLGVGKDEDGKMIAHSWIKVGGLYVSGGDGSEYACVARFRNKRKRVA